MKIKLILELSLTLAKYNFRLKNEGSYIGIFWYMLNPLLLFTLLFLVFGDRLGFDIANYPAYMLLGIVMFNFFQQTTKEATKIIISNAETIKFITLPREILVISMVIKNAFSHIFEIAAFMIIMIFLGSTFYGIIFYPLLFILLLFFTLGISFLLSSIAVYFTDLDNIWIFVSYLLWLATPIFYDIGGQEKLLLFNMFNPLYYFITIGREIIIYSRIPELWILGGALFYSVLSIVVGLIVFRSLKDRFAEMI